MAWGEAALAAAADLVFPQACLLCGRELAFVKPRPRWPLCHVCAGSLRRASGARCNTCGRLLSEGETTCWRCRGAAFRFTSLLPLFEFEGHAKEVLYLYKFEGRRRLAGFLAEHVARAVGERWPGLPLVPVPGRPRVLRRRGWEHVGEIARLLAREHGVEVLPCLARSGDSQQKGLGFAARSANIRGRIRVSGRWRLGGRDVVLLDDVFTTGATADECARVLLEAGAGRVFVVAIALD